MRLTWIGQRFDWDALCEQHHATDIDRAVLRATLCGWRRSGNGLAETYSASNNMRLTWIGQRFGWDSLCEQHHAADVDQVPIWRGALCEQQHAADMDRATVWPRRTLRATSCGWCRSGTDLAGCTLRATACGWHGSGYSLAEMHSASDIMRLTWIRQRFGRDTSEQHYAANVDRATVGQRFGTVRILLNPTSCHKRTILRIQLNSMISQSFDAAVHPSA